MTQEKKTTMPDNPDKSQEKKEKTKVFLARTALVLMGVFIVAACLGMAFGSKEVMMASLFCVVFVPILLWMLIVMYDKSHGKSKREREEYEKNQKNDKTE